MNLQVLSYGAHVWYMLGVYYKVVYVTSSSWRIGLVYIVRTTRTQAPAPGEQQLQMLSNNILVCNQGDGSLAVMVLVKQGLARAQHADGTEGAVVSTRAPAAAALTPAPADTVARVVEALMNALLAESAASVGAGVARSTAVAAAGALASAQDARLATAALVIRGALEAAAHGLALAEEAHLGKPAVASAVAPVVSAAVSRALAAAVPAVLAGPAMVVRVALVSRVAWVTAVRAARVRDAWRVTAAATVAARLDWAASRCAGLPAVVDIVAQAVIAGATPFGPPRTTTTGTSTTTVRLRVR